MALKAPDRYLDRNPFGDMERRTEPLAADVAPLRPRQIQAFLYAAWEYYPELVPYFVLAFYGCLRAFGEMIRVTWNEIDMDDNEILLPRSMSKVYKPRYIDIRQCLLKWLSVWLRAYPTKGSGPILSCSYGVMREKREILARIIGMDAWISNIARKTSASYMDRVTDEIETAKQHGNSPPVPRSSYLQPVRRADANEFVRIMPPDWAPGQGRMWLVADFHSFAVSGKPKTKPELPF